MAIVIYIILICALLFYARSKAGTAGYTIVRTCFMPILIGAAYMILVRAILKYASVNSAVYDTVVFLVGIVTTAIIIAIIVWWLKLARPEWFDNEPLDDFDPTKYDRSNTTEEK